MAIPQIKRRHVSYMMGTVAFVAVLSQFMGPTSPSDIRNLRSVEGDIIREAVPFEDLITQRELASSKGDCITLPTVHDTDPTIVSWAMNNMVRDAELAVGEEAEKPEVRKLGPGANYVVWDKSPGDGEVPEWFMDKPRASAWNATMALEDENIGLVRPIRWEMHEEGRVLEGDYVGFHNWIHKNYANLLMEHLPLMAWMDQEVVSPDTKFIVVDSPLMKQILSKLDPDFYEQRVVWIKPGELFHVTGDLMVAMPEKFPIRGLMPNLLTWLRKLHPEPTERSNIIYYSRHPDQIRNGRVMDVENEREVIDVIRHKMVQQLGRSADELIIFNGINELGEQMSFERQFEIFSRAQTIIGPQGGGLANLLWSAAHPTESCGDRTQVLEFFSTSSLYASFYGLPIDHHLLPFTQRSTLSTTYINLRDLKDGLDVLWHDKVPQTQSNVE